MFRAVLQKSVFIFVVFGCPQLYAMEIHQSTATSLISPHLTG